MKATNREMPRNPKKQVTKLMFVEQTKMKVLYQSIKLFKHMRDANERDKLQRSSGSVEIPPHGMSVNILAAKAF